jgi:hypothetical protein
MSLEVKEAGQIAAAAISGFGIWQLTSMFQNNAPKLSDLRSTTGDDPKAKQDLSDAAITTGAIAFLAGGLASYAAKSLLPLLIVAAVWLLLVLAHYRVLKGEAV